jgi:hypothetical protein
LGEKTTQGFHIVRERVVDTARGEHGLEQLLDALLGMEAENPAADLRRGNRHADQREVLQRHLA